MIGKDDQRHASPERASIVAAVRNSWRRASNLIIVSRALALILIALTAFGPRLEAQDQQIVSEALQIFPDHTTRLEYWNSAKLRTLSNYARLHQRYLDPSMQKLEKSLATLGIQASDINEVVLGWQGGVSASGTSEFELYGLAAGHFNAKDTARRADAAGLQPTLMAGLPAYCFAADANSTCLALLGDTRGVFGSLHTLEPILNARTGMPSSLGSSQFATLVQGARSDAAIWGLAAGAAIGDWFRSAMPVQQNLQLDWSQTFNEVDVVSYSIDTAADNVRLAIKLDCATPDAAARVSHMLSGLRSLQQLAWQTQNPGQTNPFQNVEIDSTGSRVELRLVTPYSSV
jgi:hypothetical protein